MKEAWQMKFLKYGTQAGYGDLSGMVNIVNEIIEEQFDEQEKLNQEALASSAEYYKNKFKELEASIRKDVYNSAYAEGYRDGKSSLQTSGTTLN